MTVELQEKFEVYHAANPAIYRMFSRLSKQAAQHRETFSAIGIVGQVRWDSMLSKKQGEFKINNNYAAYYGRLFEKDFPEYTGFFLKRAV